MRPATPEDHARPRYSKGSSVYNPVIQAAIDSPLGVIVERGVDFPADLADAKVRYAFSRPAEQNFGRRISMHKLNADEYLLEVVGDTNGAR